MNFCLPKNIGFVLRILCYNGRMGTDEIHTRAVRGWDRLETDWDRCRYTPYRLGGRRAGGLVRVTKRGPWVRIQLYVTESRIYRLKWQGSPVYQSRIRHNSARVQQIILDPTLYNLFVLEFS